MVYTHVLNRGGLRVRSPVDGAQGAGALVAPIWTSVAGDQVGGHIGEAVQVKGRLGGRRASSGLEGLAQC